MKNDRQTYIADLPPACQTDVRFVGKADEPIGSDPLQNHPARLIEYDDWIWQEEKEYFRLLAEQKKARWLARHDLSFGGSNKSCPLKGDAQTGSLRFDIGKPQGVECDVSRMMNDLLLSECGTTSSTDNEIHHGCSLTMEQMLLRHNKPPSLEKDWCLYNTSTQQSTAFEYTLSVRGRNTSCSLMIEVVQAARSQVSETGGSETMNVNRLWLDVGELYSRYSEYDSTAAINSAGSEASQRIGNWYPGSHWRKFLWPIPMDSIIVESVRLVLQRWRGVCSFSQPMRSDGSGERHENVYSLCPRNKVDLENDYAQVILKGSEI